MSAFDEEHRDASQGPPGHEECTGLEREAVELVELLGDDEGDREGHEGDDGDGGRRDVEERVNLFHGAGV
jgi:hypothetical protein